MPTEDLLGRLVAFQSEAWQELYGQYFKKMYSYAYSRTGDAQASEDIANEVFAAAVSGIARYRQTGAPIGAWLYRIARNQTVDYLETRRRKPQVSLEGVDIEAAGWASQSDDRRDLIDGMSTLTLEQQQVLQLRFMQDCSLAETAEAMGKNIGAVKLLQHRALGALRKRLSDPQRGQR